MSESRREFVERMGRTALGVGCGFPLLEAACSAVDHAAADAGTTTSQWAMVIDVERCRRDDVRQACIEACHRLHNVPRVPESEDQVRWIRTEAYEHVFPDQVHARTAPSLRNTPVLALCNHCDRPPCVRVCPTGATWKRESDGIVMMDMHRCIGCRYCMAACPYGARSFNWRDPTSYVERDGDNELLSSFPTRSKGVVEKCNFCAERIRDGLSPACVEAAASVPGGEGALTFGSLADPDSAVSHILRTEHTIVRRIGLGTGPNVYYIV